MDQLERYRWLVVALLAVPLLVGIGFLFHDRLSGPEPLQINSEGLPSGDIRVYITGAVQRPGVYPLQDGERWIDALEAAGGPTDDADLTAVNLARRAQDEDQIIVPRLGQTAAAGASQSPLPAGQAGLVNINTASQADLEALPGIGPVRASAIVQSRSANGPFTDPEQLMERDLIPRSVYDTIVALITVGP